jgi:hypothetical protein
MADQESALTLIKSNDFLKDDIPNRVWMIAYSDKKTFFLNDEERATFLKGLADGNTIIQIGSLTLSNRFIYMYQFKNKPVHKEYKFVGNKAVEV